MAFIKVKSISGAETEYSFYSPVDGEAITLGEVLVPTTGGRITASTATTSPEFVAISSLSAATPQTNKCALLRIGSNDEFEVKTALTVADTNIGERRTLSSDGLNITATTTGGVFLISSTNGIANASTVRGYFKR